MIETRNVILYFMSQPGCSHCALTRPAVDAYRQANLGKVFVMELNVMRHPSIDDFEPKGTPAFALKVDSILMATFEGSMSAKQIETFVKRGIEGKGTDHEDPAPRRRRRSTKGRGQAPDQGGDHVEEPEHGLATGSDDS